MIIWERRLLNDWVWFQDFNFIAGDSAAWSRHLGHFHSVFTSLMKRWKSASVKPTQILHIENFGLVSVGKCLLVGSEFNWCRIRTGGRKIYSCSHRRVPRHCHWFLWDICRMCKWVVRWDFVSWLYMACWPNYCNCTVASDVAWKNWATLGPYC